jgi:NIMA (never in mitosis gene a)-related kinase
MSISNFEIISKLGEGSFSSVFKVVRKSDQQIYALKKVKLTALKHKEKENSLNEVRILASVNHSNIVSYKEAFIDEAANMLCIVMELADGGDLLSKITKNKVNREYFPESEIWNAMIQITFGLQYLHEARILHRDLKGANIFITKEGIYKLGDLNVSKVNKKGLAYTQTGTPYYASPEIWQDKPYDWSSDIWSLGCVLYEMAALAPPFTAVDMKGLYNKVTKGIYPRLPNIYSSDLCSVIGSMIQVNPKSRPSCQQILSRPEVQRNNKSPLFHPPSSSIDLLGTIKFDSGLRGLSKKLPAAQYEGTSDLPISNNLSKIEEFIPKPSTRGPSNPQLRRGYEVQGPREVYSGITSSPKNSLPGSRNNSRDHIPVVKGELPQPPKRGSDIYPNYPGKKGESHLEEYKGYINHYSPNNRGNHGKPPAYGNQRNDIYNNYPDIRPPAHQANYNQYNRGRVEDSARPASKPSSQQGSRPGSNLNKAGNMILQSPKHLMPKGLPNSQRYL